MQIKVNGTYRFKKSGNLVKTVEATNYGGEGNWVVERVDTGKQMVVHGGALVDPKDENWS